MLFLYYFRSKHLYLVTSLEILPCRDRGTDPDPAFISPDPHRLMLLTSFSSSPSLDLAYIYSWKYIVKMLIPLPNYLAEKSRNLNSNLKNSKKKYDNEELRLLIMLQYV